MQTVRCLFVLALCACVGLVTAHYQCEVSRVSLGLAVTSEQCQQRCQSLRSDDTSSKSCIAWAHRNKTETCTGWILDDDVEHGDYDYDYFYGPGRYYDYSYIDYSTCMVANGTDISVAHTRNAEKRSGCYFESKNLGYAATPEECQYNCESLESNIHGGCVAWSHSEEEHECEGLLSRATNDFDTCGRP